MSKKYFKGVVSYRETANDEWEVQSAHKIEALPRVTPIVVRTVAQLKDALEGSVIIDNGFVSVAQDFALDAFGVTIERDAIEKHIASLPLQKLVKFGVKYDEMRDATASDIDKITYAKRISKRGTRYTQNGIVIGDVAVPTTANGQLRAAKSFDTNGIMGLIKPLIENALQIEWLADYEGHVLADLQYTGSVTVKATKQA